MGTTLNESAWSTTAATNANSDLGVNWAEGQDAASVNDSGRGMMTARARARLDQGGERVATGTPNALIMTTNQVLTVPTHLAAGLRLALRAIADNTSTTVTLAVDGSTPAPVKRVDGSALAVGSIKSGMMLDLVYNAGSSEWRVVNIAPFAAGGGAGVQFLASDTVSAVASVPIVLTGYTGYRGIKFVLTDTRPVTDGVYLLMRFSTNGGASYIATNVYDSAASAINAELGSVDSISLTVSGILIQHSGANYVAGNAAPEGYNGEIILLNQTSATSWPKVSHDGTYITSQATPRLVSIRGGGMLRSTGAINAVQFIYTSGNVAICTYAVYGLV